MPTSAATGLNLLSRARPSQANSAFRRLQVFSSSFVAFSHGANDAQKTMAIITLALFSSGHLSEFVVPTWVALAAALAIGLGTWAGGWRIIRTMGTRIVRMQPVHGFAAQTVAATVIQLATAWGLPVSTTQVVSGAVMGAGATHRFSAVRWGGCPSHRMGMDLHHARLCPPRRLSCAPRENRATHGHDCYCYSGNGVTLYARAADEAGEY